MTNQSGPTSRAPSTGDLMESLSASENLDTFFTENESQFCGEDIAAYLNQLLRQKHLRKSTVIRRSMLSEIYAYQIFGGVKKPRRDKLLCLALGMGLSLEETQKMLRVCGFPPLYVRHQRDCVIIHALLHQLTVSELNALLDEKHMPLCL
ncbi:MAG TPA: hypothetical protein H9691_08545 [Firmicutes bacterium]|nr:hypothetical protein [Bacillota bacterium]